MLISHKDHNNAKQVYSVTVMTHVKALEAGQSSQGTSELITPVWGVTCDISIHPITSLVNINNFAMDDWFY